jgi:cytochrome oxidase Cu insertion factor (SCO1/SenC/PrrC family)
MVHRRFSAGAIRYLLRLVLYVVHQTRYLDDQRQWRCLPLTRRFQGKTALAYTLEHSSFLYLLDPRGRIRMLYPMSADVPAMAQDLRTLWRTE